MKYRLNKTGKVFNSLEELEDSLMPKSPEDFVLVPNITESEYSELLEFVIIPDEYPKNPIDDTIFNWVTAHRRYTIGNINFNSRNELQDYIEAHKDEIEWSEKHGLYHTIFMYDHSGIVLYLDGEGYHDWDYGQIGFIFASPEDIKHTFGWSEITKKRIAILQDMLEKEFQALKNYAEGNTYMLYCIDENCIYEHGTYNELKEIFNKQYFNYGILVEKEAEFSEV